MPTIVKPQPLRSCGLSTIKLQRHRFLTVKEVSTINQRASVTALGWVEARPRRHRHLCLPLPNDARATTFLLQWLPSAGARTMYGPRVSRDSYYYTTSCTSLPRLAIVVFSFYGVVRGGADLCRGGEVCLCYVLISINTVIPR